MKHRMTSWRAFFRARNRTTGEVIEENEILSAGIEMTLRLWNADTTERFDRIRLEDSNNDEVATEIAARSWNMTTSGDDPLGVFTCSALFDSASISTAVEYAVLLGSNGTFIARAPLSLETGFAYEIERVDYLGESSNVIPAT